MKQIVVYFVLSFFFLTASAQELSVGLRGGLNVAKITNYNDDWGCFGNVGLFGEWKKDCWALETDVLYSMQGADFDGYRQKDHYLLIPLKGKYYIPACKGLNVLLDLNWIFVWIAIRCCLMEVLLPNLATVCCLQRLVWDIAFSSD